MNRKINFLTLALCGFCALNSCDNSETETDQKPIMKIPMAEIIPTKLEKHGSTRIDNYYWLNQREDKKVLDYLNSENAYAENFMQDVKVMEDSLFEEIKGRIQQTDMSVPYNLKGYSYYNRYEEGKEYPIYCRKKIAAATQEEIMLEVNEMAKGHDYYAVGGREVSPDNKILAYGVDTVSRRIYTLCFKNLETGEELTDKLQGTEGRLAWANDNKTVFYTSQNPVTLRSDKIFKHTLGTPQEEDELVFEEKDDTFGVFVYKSKSDDYIFIGSYSTLSTEYRFLPADNPNGEFKIIQPRERDLEYSVTHYGDKFFIRTNLDAKNFKVVETSVTQTGKENWKDLIPARDNVLVEDIDIFKDYLVISERKEGLTHLRIKPWDLNVKDHYISFQDPAYTAYTSVNPEFDSQLLRYGYTSLTTPNSIYDYNMNTRESELLKQQEVVGGYIPEEYQSERVFAKADDGTEIPISIVYKKGFHKDGTQPVLLYGYGSYGASMDAYFSSSRLSLLNRGFAFAIAHVRGGEEMGRHWYEDGKLLNKKNTFTDFIACGNFLVENKYAAKDQLFAMGGSAGGLLMGAVVNMAPDMWKGVVAQVPFVDVVTTMLDESIPLTTGEYDEWGNPNDKVFYDYMLSYSPYDNVVKQNYPAMLVTTGLHDSQVQYWEPAKWVAKLRTHKTDTNPLLLVTNMEAGHGGASGRFQQFKEIALDYAFLLKMAGIKE